ncbi:putative reverse transcriptase domain-containing protein [Tanacetum coccineum]
MPVELGSFDVIIGMDWLRRYHAVIVCDEKLVQVPYMNKTLTFYGDESSNGRESRLTVISCSKAQAYMAKGCQVFLAQISAKKKEDKSERKQIEDVPIVQDFPEVFPEDLPGLPPARPVEFQIDLIPGAAPVARAPYRLAPSEMKELSEQLQELYDKAYMWTGQDRSIMDLGISKTPTEIGPFLGLAGYYRRFIEGFSKIAKSNDENLSEGEIEIKRKSKFDFFFWGGEKEENAFQLITQKLCSALILALHEGSEDFVVYCDASHKGLGAVESKRSGAALSRMWQEPGLPASIICDRDGRFTSNFWRSFQKALGTDISMSTAYHPETDGQSGENIQLSRLVTENNRKFIADQARMQRHRIEKSSYAYDRKRKPMEGSKLETEVMIKKCYADEPLVMPLEGIHVDDKLQFVEEPVEIMEREIKRLKRSRIPLVKVRWNSRRGPEFTWEREDSELPAKVNKARGTEDPTEEEIATQATQTSTQTPTSKIFEDDETIAKVLLNMSKAKTVSREKEKGVELKDVEETDRPKPTSTRSLLTLKPLPKIDPKDKGKKKIEEVDESESESDDIPQAEKKFKQLESDEELSRKIQEEWEAEEERNIIAEENAANEVLIRDFDDMKARIEAGRLLAEKLQEQEREKFTIEERAKFLHDTIAAQRKFLAQQRSEAIRNKPPTNYQLRNQMMTYLKHVGNYKHSELKIKKFEEIQALYEKIKRSDEDFISIGSAEDEKLIKRMNEKGVGLSKSEVIKEESKEEVQKEDKDEESTRKRKLGTRKKMKSRKRRYIQNTSEDDSDKENDELRLYLTVAQDEEKEVDYEILDRKYPIKEWKTECLGAKPQTDQAEHLEEINLNVVIRSNGQKRYFSTLMTVLSIFDREDLNAVYQLVMEKYHDEMPEGFDRVLWGNLMVMFNPDDENEFWNAQQDWKIVSWKLHGSSGIHTLVTDTGLVIHMLVEKKYPLRKEVLMQMLKLKLESEEENTMALELIKFVKKILAKLESEEHKNWLVHKQTACELAIPEQTATGKGTSNPLMAAQQIELDNALVALENRRIIGKCNMRINPGMKPKEPTYQVALDALALTTCYPAFLITAEVPKFSVNVKVFRDILNICLRILGQEFDEPPSEEEALSFIPELGHSREIKYIIDVIIDHLHQPWRTFASIINKCLCRKIDNIDSKKQDKILYPRFTKKIIYHFLEKDKSNSMRNIMFMHTARDDSLLGTMRFVSRHVDTQVYGAILPEAMTNRALLDSVAYMTYYAITLGAEPLKSRKRQKKSDLAIGSEESPSKKKSTKAKKVAATKPK